MRVGAFPRGQVTTLRESDIWVNTDDFTLCGANSPNAARAWLIELLSTGKNVVMPPSIHPDTGHTYKLIQHELIPVQPLTHDMLPESLRPWIVDIAHRMQCPIDFVAAAAVVMLGSVIGTRNRFASLRASGYPVGQEPLLVTNIHLAPDGKGALRIGFEEKMVAKPAPRGFHMTMASPLLHGFTHLLESAIKVSEWGILDPQKPIADAADAAMESRPSDPPRYLN